MSSRRNLLLTRDQIADKSRTARDKVVTLRDLSQTRVIIPNEVYDTGMSVIVTVANDGRLQPGLIESTKIPVTRPISDLTKLNRARNVVSSLEVVQTRTSSIEEVKEVLVTALAATEVNLNTVAFKPGIQAELIRCKVLSETLAENQSAYAGYVVNKTSRYANVAERWFTAAQAAITVYILDVQCGNRNQKLLEIVSEMLVPRWFFNRFTVKVPELTTTSIEHIFFPKKVSKSIVFTAGEVESETFFKNSGGFHQNLLYLRRVLKLHVTKDKTAVLYPIPSTISTRIHDFSDLPVIDRVLNASTILSITVLHMLYNAVPIKAMSADTLTDHISSFLYEDGDVNREIVFSVPCSIVDVKQYDDISKLLPKSEIQENDNRCLCKAIVTSKKSLFSYDPDSSVPMKAQYREYLAAKLQDPIGIVFPLHYAKIFHLTDQEHSVIEVILFDHGSSLPDATYVQSIFLPLKEDIKLDEARVKLARDRLSIIKPVDIKQLNFGPISSSLSKKADAFIRGLELKHFPKPFVSNVSNYLQSFNLLQFQDQAVKIMTASLQSREVILVSTEPDVTPASEAEEEIPDFGEF